jgi:type I restriction enzyme S subunit
VDDDPPVRLCNYTDVYYRDSINPAQDFMQATASREQISAFRLRTDDVIITKDSESADDIGVPSYVEASMPDLVCGYHLAMIRPLKKLIDGRFLFWAMSSSSIRSQLEVAATGITRFGLRADAIGRATLSLPSLPAQRAIADFLDAETARIDALIAKKRRLVTRLQERRAATMIRGVSRQLLPGGETVDSGLSWIGRRPEHWDEPLLKLVARLGSGHTPSRSRSEWWMDCTIPWITTGEVSQMREDRIEYITETREKISELGMANSSAELHLAGTVVLSRTASAGFSAIMGMDMATSQDFVTWTCGPLLNPRYLLLCLRAMRQDLLGRLAQGSTHQTIYMPDIESIQIPLPPLEEQEAIVDAIWRSLCKIDGIIDRLDRQMKLLAEHRQALITAAVTGQIDVPGAAAS